MTVRLRQGLDLAFGVMLSLLPGLAPFFAIPALLAERLSLQRADLAWLLGVLALTGPAWLAGAWSSAAEATLQLGVGWLIFKAFRTLAPTLRPERPWIRAGLVLGLGVAVALAARNVEVDWTQRGPTFLLWGGDPAIYGHAILTLGLLIALLVERSRLRTVALGISAAGILLSGSREAGLAWVLAASFLVWRVPSRGKRRAAEVGLVVLMVLVSVGVGDRFGFGRLGFLLEPGGGEARANLLRGTEQPRGGWWYDHGVSVRAGRVELGGLVLARYTVRKESTESWQRLQQALTLEPGTTYTMSAWLHPLLDSEPGLQGWGEQSDGDDALTVTGTLRDGEWFASGWRSGSLVSSGVAEREDRWRRAWVTFTYQGEEPLLWWVGLAPDARSGTLGGAHFAGFQVEEGAGPGPYVAGAASQGLDLANARLPYWRSAWQGFTQRPLLGWGDTPFAEYYREQGAQLARFYAVPAHTHNLVLQTLYRSGLIGFLGLLLLLSFLFRSAWRGRDVGLTVALGAVLFANMLDYTLFAGQVFYPLMAVVGWRSGRAGFTRSHTAGEASRQFGTRLTLALVDLATAALSLTVAQWLTGAGGEGATRAAATAYYALLAWPMLAWREGLYPGYGLTAAQELKKATSVTTFAVLLLTAGTVLVPAYLSLNVGTLLLLLALQMVLGPVGRALAKRAALAVDAWGRRVVVLGAGETGRRIVRSLQRSPLDGLTPVAFFDDDPAMRGRRVEGLRVRGTLDDADRFAERHGVRHAVVALPDLQGPELAALVDVRGRTFQTVQVVPQLPGLPTYGVVTGHLDGMLALEVRKGLLDPVNRMFKRALDLVGATTLIALLSPLLVALYAYVRLDSRGPGLYASERLGEGGRPFRCLKFRTMYADAEERLARMLRDDPAVRDEYLRWHKLGDDPRITRAGRLIRKFSLDELPQLWNVLTGEMSLIGPRPYLVRERDDMAGYGAVILQAKPGMTGFWQVVGRNDVTFQERLEMEAHYVRNWSVWWDLILLIRTPQVLLARNGAR